MLERALSDENSGEETVYLKGCPMARLATKPHLVASLNVMLASRKNREEGLILSQKEIIEILSAMAENDALTTNPHINTPIHWQPEPTKLV